MLEKILEDIKKQKNCCLMIGYAKEYNQGALKMAEVIEDIIRKHMNDSKDINVRSKDKDGWIPCEERLPEYLGGRIKVWMTVANGHVIEGFYDGCGFKFKNGQRIRITVQAWKKKRKPEPYRPEKGAGE